MSGFTAPACIDLIAAHGARWAGGLWPTKLLLVWLRLSNRPFVCGVPSVTMPGNARCSPRLCIGQFQAWV